MPLNGSSEAVAPVSPSSSSPAIPAVAAAAVAPASDASAALSTETTHHFREAFSFIRHEREDVRKMALHGIAAQSKDSSDLWVYLSSGAEGAAALDALLQYLHAGGKAVLGDILTILVNCSADGRCAEALVQQKVVRKSMRLLDGMERSGESLPYIRSIQEMTLMLMNNLTASHISAIDDLLQKEDEDMRGFYLGKLQVYYTKFTAGESGQPSMPVDEEASDAAKSGTVQRNLQRWILQILLNVTRTLDGQELLLEDEEWRITLLESLSSSSPRDRYLAAQCYRNCACSPQPFYALLLKSDIIVAAVERLSGKESVAEIQMTLAEFLSSTLESEEAMERLESINAKALLSAAVAASRKATAELNCRVQVIEEEGEAENSQPAKKGCTLSADVCDFMEAHVLPYLDDVVDAYIAPGSDEID